MKFFTEDAVHVGDYIYFFGRDLNLLISLKIRDGELEILGKIPEEILSGFRLCCKLILYDDKIIIVPLKAKNVWIFSLLSKEWSKIKIEDYKNNCRKSYFRSVYVYNEQIMLWGGHYPALVILHMDTNETAYYTEIFKRKTNKVNDLYFRSDPLKLDNILYFASCIDNTILKFELDSFEYTWIKVGDSANRYSGIAWDGHYFWLSPRCGTPIVRWNGNKITKDFILKLGTKKIGTTFLGIFPRNGEYFIPAMSGSGVNSVSINKNGAIRYEADNYTFYKHAENNEFFYQTSDGYLNYIDQNKITHKYILEMDDEIFLHKIKDIGIDPKEYVKGVLTEGIHLKLNSYLCYLVG